MTSLPDTVDGWIRHRADLLRQHQTDGRYVPDRPTPEVEAVQHVIDALCDATCPWAGAVMEFVDRKRAGMEAA